jgi:hypothetical protein
MDEVIHYIFVGFEVLIVVVMNVASFWDIVPCSAYIQALWHYIPEDGSFHYTFVTHFTILKVFSYSCPDVKYLIVMTAEYLNNIIS